MERAAHCHREFDPMSFVSYAQNFEDVMLWRALKNVDLGFYVDVGANDPEIDSVTKAFYERGWRGINIEPIPQWFERLQKERPRDINLQLAAGREPGEITLFEIPDTELSTAERAFVERHKSERGYRSRKLKVPVETLTNLCERYHTAPIHFLKIDVEGMEKAVLEGTDFKRIRPWIVLLESTLSMSQEECHAEWEPILLDARYEYVYFDGLNRFYVANEHSELLDAFKYPPNVFDDFTLRRQQEAEIRASEAESKAREAEARAAQAEAKAEEAEAKAGEAEARAAQAEAALQAIYQSRSWRITRPLRELAGLVRHGRDTSKRAVKRLIAPPLSRLIRFAVSRPWVKRLALTWIRRHPRIEARLRRFATQRGLTGPQAAKGPSIIGFPGRHHDFADLSPRARKIYFQLKAAVEQNRKEND